MTVKKDSSSGDSIERFMPQGAANPVAPYSHATRWRDLVHVTGQMPFDRGVDRYVDGPADVQLDACMRNLDIVLKGAGSDWDHVLNVRIYLTDFSAYEAVNVAYKKWFRPGFLPARTCVGVTGLAGGALVEVDLVAVRAA
ncbi:MAG: RidA family protein [Rhodospirillales bacterium]